MPQKVKVAISWAAACGGCDVSILDIEEKLLELAQIAEFVYWPVALDFKRSDLLAHPDASIDVGIFNGAIRTREHEEDARIFRQKCKVLVAYGACASFGGIPGLGNLAEAEELLSVAYETTPSTDNPEKLRPETQHSVAGHTLTLPAFQPHIRCLSQVVDVDLVLPGCPPPHERVLDLVSALAAYAEDTTLPAAGTILASAGGLCEECPRAESRQGGRILEIKRPHEVISDPRMCFLEQGILCAGIATRGGCGATCIEAHAPCRGCFGPAPGVMDPGAEALSAIGSIAGAANENDVPAHEMKKIVRSVRDPAGTFYRFALPSALLPHALRDAPTKEDA